MTAKRAAAVVWPHSARTYIAHIVSKAVVAVIVVLSGILTLHVFFQDGECYLESQLEFKSEHEDSPWAWVHFALIFCIPFIVIVVSSHVLIVQVCLGVQQREREQCTRG